MAMTFSLAMSQTDGDVQKFETLEALETVLKTEGAAIAKATSGYYSGVAAWATAYALTHEGPVSTAKILDTFECEVTKLSPSNRTKLAWAIGEGRKALKDDVDAGTDDVDAIAAAIAHFKGFPIFVAYNNKDKAKDAPKAKADKAANDDTDQTDKGVKAQSAQTPDEALAVLMAAYRHLQTLAQGGDTLAQTHLDGFLTLANGEAKVMEEAKAA